jgi:organic radical activating enzyme
MSDISMTPEPEHPMIQFPWKSNDIPHAVLEVNSRCNIRCRACYHHKAGWTKPVPEILAELDVLVDRQNPQTVSLAGGEPTLHPELPDIVSAIRKRGLRVALITNGVLLDEARLARLADAGLDLVMLHIDEGQKRPDLPENASIEDLNARRWNLAERIRVANIQAGLSVTLYPDTLENLLAMIPRFLDTPEFSFLFVTHSVDLESLSSDGTTGAGTGNADIVRELEHRFGFHPHAGVPSQSGDRFSLLSYFVPVRLGNGTPVRWRSKSGRLDAGLMALARRLHGRNLFYCPPTGAAVRAQVLCNGLGSGRFRHALEFVFGGGTLIGKRLLFEESPRRNAQGELECCRHCPNHTVRRGRIVPVCQADREPAGIGERP